MFFFPLSYTQIILRLVGKDFVHLRIFSSMHVAFLALEFPAAFFLFCSLSNVIVMVKQEDKNQFWEVVRGVGLIPRVVVEGNCVEILQESQWCVYHLKLCKKGKRTSEIVVGCTHNVLYQRLVEFQRLLESTFTNDNLGKFPKANVVTS